MRKPLLVAMCLAALLAAFLLGRASVVCGVPADHVEWLKGEESKGPLSESLGREAAMMSAAEARIGQYVGIAIPMHYTEWRGWVFVVVRVQPIVQAPLIEYRILAYREIEDEWVLLDEWRWSTNAYY